MKSSGKPWCHTGSGSNIHNQTTQIIYIWTFTICSIFSLTQLKLLTWQNLFINIQLKWKQCQTLFGGAPKSLQIVIAAMKLRCLLLGQKVMTNLDSIFKSRDITLPTKVLLVKAMVFGFSCGHVWM